MYAQWGRRHLSRPASCRWNGWWDGQDVGDGIDVVSLSCDLSLNTGIYAYFFEIVQFTLYATTHRLNGECPHGYRVGSAAPGPYLSLARMTASLLASARRWA